MPRNMYSFIAALALGWASITSDAQAAPTYRLTLIGSRLPADLAPLVITGLNDKGEVVGARPSDDAGLAAFVWRDGVFQDLRPLLGNPPSSAILGSNDKSVMMGWYEEERNDPDTLHFFLLSRGKVTLIETPPALTLFSIYDMNDRGQVVLSAQDEQFAQHYFTWQRGRSSELESLPGAAGNTVAVALNDRGLVAGTAFFEDHAVPVLWQDGSIMPLDLPADAVAATATQLNNEAVVIGQATLPTHSQPFVWKEGEATLLPPLNGKSKSQVSNINDRGVIIGTSYNDSSGEGFSDPVATLWRRGRALDVNTLVAADDPLKPFVQLQSALSINNRGQLVVTGHDSRDADPTQIEYYFLTSQ